MLHYFPLNKKNMKLTYFPVRPPFMFQKCSKEEEILLTENPYFKFISKRMTNFDVIKNHLKKNCINVHIWGVKNKVAHRSTNINFYRDFFREFMSYFGKENHFYQF